ncbi:hypothetical protein [Roseateles sp.]|uniref:hypothetical protein n=1 Tax=Roseateles sp. TaxID=1971397 RepID=UPI00286A817C|nr:hypothetical protein [Roseateles sp.]
MMNKFWRIAFAWMLALALPVQGYAAHAMMFCGPAHHGTAQAQAHDHASHDHGDAGRTSHDTAGAHADAEADASPSADGELVKVESAKTAGAGKCSVCASCCSAAAITTSIIQIEVVPQHESVVATLASAHDLVLIGGLERPPRLSLA